MAKPPLELVTPSTEKCTVADPIEVPRFDFRRHLRRSPGRPPNDQLRKREHLFNHEVETLIKTAAKANRHGRRDALMILLAYRHGLRAAEVVDLQWQQVDFKSAHLHVHRLKGGVDTTHPLVGRELRELRKHERLSQSPKYLFVSERGAPMTARAFSRMVERVGVEAKLGIKVHAHMLRHACGFKLANDGHDTRSLQDYLGHKNIQNTARYTALAPGRFKNFWRD